MQIQTKEWDRDSPPTTAKLNGDLLKCFCNVIDKNMFIQSLLGATITGFFSTLSTVDARIY